MIGISTVFPWKTIRNVAPVGNANSFLNSSIRAGLGQPNLNEAGIVLEAISVIFLFQGENKCWDVVSLLEYLKLTLKALCLSDITTQKLCYWM